MNYFVGAFVALGMSVPQTFAVGCYFLKHVGLYFLYQDGFSEALKLAERAERILYQIDMVLSNHLKQLGVEIKNVFIRYFLCCFVGTIGSQEVKNC